MLKTCKQDLKIACETYRHTCNLGICAMSRLCCAFLESGTVHQSGDCTIFCAISRLRDHKLQTFDPNHATAHVGSFESFLDFRGVTRILRSHQIVGKMCTMPM